MSELEIHLKKSLAAVEETKFIEMVQAIGQNTLVALANAGPE